MLAACLLAGLFVIRAGECREGAARGLESCARVLIPSLFPFMVLSNLLVRTGVCHASGRRLEGLTRRLFRLSGAFAPVILLSLIGGYPVGAGAVAGLYESGAVEEREAKRAALFCVCAGPGFMLNYVGASLYNSVEVGAVMLAAQALSVIVLGALLALLDRKEVISGKEIKYSPLPFSAALVRSVSDAARAMLSLCASVVVFSAFSGIVRSAVPEGGLSVCLEGLVEITAAFPRMTAELPVAAAAFFAGFGGLCVHAQIFGTLGGLRISAALFFLIRIVQGLLTAGLTRLGLLLLPGELAVFSTGTVSGAGVFGGSVISAVALLTVTIVFLKVITANAE